MSFPELTGLSRDHESHALPRRNPGRPGSPPLPAGSHSSSSFRRCGISGTCGAVGGPEDPSRDPLSRGPACHWSGGGSSGWDPHPSALMTLASLSVNQVFKIEQINFLN